VLYRQFLESHQALATEEGEPGQGSPAAIPPDVRSHMDNLLLVSESAVISGFENLKADPGRPGVDNFQGEIGKLRAIRAIGLRAEPFAEVPWKVLQMFKRRATNEKASEMREHPEGIPNQDFSFSRSNILQSPLSF
jgi:hypothetical protein